ncbi:hypothetical protein ABPG73_002439 [Tetrahymena malaccensis]
MKRMPDKIIKSKNYSNQQVKKLPAIHLLEVVLNYLYSNYILLRNIKLQKFLLQGISRHYKRLGSDVRILQNYKKKLQKVTYAYYGQKVKHQSRISIHHLVDRVVISELDSLKILKKQFIQHEDTDFNCIKMKLLGGSEKQKKQDQKFEDHTSQLIPDKMIVEQQNYQTINKKNKSQQTYYNQNLNENKPLNQIEGENSIKNKYLNEMSKQISYQANSDEKINEEQQDQFNF